MISTKLSLQQAQTYPLLKEKNFQPANFCHIEQYGGYFGFLKGDSWGFLLGILHIFLNVSAKFQLYNIFFWVKLRNDCTIRCFSYFFFSVCLLACFDTRWTVIFPDILLEEELKQFFHDWHGVLILPFLENLIQFHYIVTALGTSATNKYKLKVNNRKIRRRCKYVQS